MDLYEILRKVDRKINLTQHNCKPEYCSICKYGYIESGAFRIGDPIPYHCQLDVPCKDFEHRR